MVKSAPPEKKGEEGFGYGRVVPWEGKAAAIISGRKAGEQVKWDSGATDATE